MRLSPGPLLRQPLRLRRRGACALPPLLRASAVRRLLHAMAAPLEILVAVSAFLAPCLSPPTAASLAAVSSVLGHSCVRTVVTDFHCASMSAQAPLIAAISPGLALFLGWATAVAFSSVSRRAWSGPVGRRCADANAFLQVVEGCQGYAVWWPGFLEASEELHVHLAERHAFHSRWRPRWSNPRWGGHDWQTVAALARWVGHHNSAEALRALRPFFGFLNDAHTRVRLSFYPNADLGPLPGHVANDARARDRWLANRVEARQTSWQRMFSSVSTCYLPFFNVFFKLSALTISSFFFRLGGALPCSVQHGRPGSCSSTTSSTQLAIFCDSSALCCAALEGLPRCDARTYKLSCVLTGRYAIVHVL